MADFLDQAFPTEEAPADPVVDAEIQPAPETPPVQPEAPQVPEQVAEPPAPEPVAQPREQQAIPLATALQWRDEAREYKRRAEAAEASQAPAAQAPDPFDDPEGFAAHQRQELQSALWTERLSNSDFLAREKYGAETVEAAGAWAAQKAQADPIFAQQFAAERFPMDWIVRQHKRDALLAEVGDVSSVDDWFTREATKRGYAPQSASPEAAQIPVAAVTQPAGRPPAPPRSIASDAPAPANVQGDPRSEFLAIFDRK